MLYGCGCDKRIGRGCSAGVVVVAVSVRVYTNGCAMKTIIASDKNCIYARTTRLSRWHTGWVGLAWVWFEFNRKPSLLT